MKWQKHCVAPPLFDQEGPSSIKFDLIWFDLIWSIIHHHPSSIIHLSSIIYHYHHHHHHHRLLGVWKIKYEFSICGMATGWMILSCTCPELCHTAYSFAKKTRPQHLRCLLCSSAQRIIWWLTVIKTCTNWNNECNVIRVHISKIFATKAPVLYNRGVH